MGNLVAATGFETRVGGFKWARGPTPVSRRVVQLWDRSPEQDISIRGRSGARMAKLQCGKGMLDRDL